MIKLEKLQELTNGEIKREFYCITQLCGIGKENHFISSVRLDEEDMKDLIEQLKSI